MLKKHFENTKRIKKILSTKRAKNSSFCEHCLRENPETDRDGYTECCNERRVFGEEAMALAKAEDIHRFLGTKFRVSSNGYPERREFVLKNKKKSFSINCHESNEESIMATVKAETKGLRKEF